MSKRQKRQSKDRGRCNNQTGSKGVRCVFFTYNNWTKSQKSELLEWLNSRSYMEYVFQEEVGKKTGTPHLQGVFRSKSPIRWETLNNLFPKMDMKRTRDWDASMVYCSKDDTRTGEIYTSKGLVLPPQPKPYKNPLLNLKLYKYQKEVLDIIKTEPDDRTIHWYWEPNGNVGKTALMKYIHWKYKNKVIVASGKGHDIRNQANEHVNVLKYEIDIVLVTLTRTVEEFVSYEAIEQMKDGFCYSGKYAGGVININSPHVICFANFPPHYEALSEDRWKVTKIEQ